MERLTHNFTAHQSTDGTWIFAPDFGKWDIPRDGSPCTVKIHPDTMRELDKVQPTARFAIISITFDNQE